MIKYFKISQNIIYCCLNVIVEKLKFNHKNLRNTNLINSDVNLKEW